MPDPQRHISAFEQANPQAVESPRPSYDPTNAFLSILRDEAQSHVVLDTEHARGFLDAAPYCPGHCLLVPKAAGYASMLDLPQKAAEQVLREGPRLARAVAKATGCDGVNVWQNNGPAARQEVFHLSVHIFPRSHGDDMAAMMAKRQPLPREQSDAIAGRIRQALATDEEPSVGGNDSLAGERPSRTDVDRPRPHYDPGNVFLKIINGEAPSYQVLETEHVLGFLDAFPVWPGHCLIIPKTAGYASMLDLPQKAAEQVLREVPRLARAVAKATGCDGVNVWQNNGPAANQVTFKLLLWLSAGWCCVLRSHNSLTVVLGSGCIPPPCACAAALLRRRRGGASRSPQTSHPRGFALDGRKDQGRTGRRRRAIA